MSRLESAGAIGPRPVRLGGRWLYRLADLEKWAASGNGKLPSRDEWLAKAVPC